MMCVAKVTFEICFIITNKTLQETRVRRLISLAPFACTISEFVPKISSPQPESDVEITFSFNQSFISRFCQVYSR